ncbi:MAG: RsmB/NOP family class I SAM-dependent RNA methyltransferase [Alphaproteobacteria bacterium]|nr:RsmB/NOP family class I SAM-dependent RNA methyltransferase [Alphaproteobacteria bacterium]
MTPAARLQAAIEILAALETTQQPVDRYLKDFFRARRYAGAKDRRAIAERVFDILRHRARFAHRMGDANPRALMIAAMLAEGEDPAALFSGGYGPGPLSQAERATITATPAPAPPHVMGEYPEWLAPSLQRAFGARLPEEMAALQSRAPVDLRVNTLKAARANVLAALKAEGFIVAATPYSPVGIRIPPGEGSAALANSPLFLSGAFEFQDEAAQIAAALAGAEPGMRVLDLATGAGGKALALAAAMNNQGSILAFDDNPRRLAPLVERAARAGATCITSASKRGGPLWANGKFDLVFLDAPCSGTGTWRRQPELRWRLTRERLGELVRLQDWLLDDAARHTAPGGRLLYATCSLLPEENEERVAAFMARNPAFRHLDAAASWAAPIPGLGRDFRASPATTGTDGFYCALLQRDGG